MIQFNEKEAKKLVSDDSKSLVDPKKILDS